MDGDFSKGGGTSEDVARAVLNAIELPVRAPATWSRGWRSFSIPITRLLPDRWIDALLRRSLKVPSRP